MDRNILGVSNILVVEDSDEDFVALLRVFRGLGLQDHVKRCHTGSQCLTALCRPSRQQAADWSLPCLILLDLNLPGTDGREVLQTIKSDPRLKIIPVIVLTTSANPKDVEECYTSGTNAYVIKPLDFDDFTVTVGRMMEFWLQTTFLPHQVA